jgi:hypothetical protein
VILADERFAYADTRGQLSVWLRPAVQPFDSFGKAAAKLSQFFRHCAATLPPPKVGGLYNKLNPVDHIA